MKDKILSFYLSYLSICCLSVYPFVCPLCSYKLGLCDFDLVQKEFWWQNEFMWLTTQTKKHILDTLYVQRVFVGYIFISVVPNNQNYQLTSK